MTRILITLSLIVLFSIAQGQTMFRDITYQDNCYQAIEKMSNYPDFSLESTCGVWNPTGDFRGKLHNLFGVGDVSLRWDGETKTLTFRAIGSKGLELVQNAVEAFTESKGQPLYLNEPTPYSPIPSGSTCTPCRVEVAGWDGIYISTYNQYYQYGVIGYVGIITISQTPPEVPIIETNDANQF